MPLARVRHRTAPGDLARLVFVPLLVLLAASCGSGTGAGDAGARDGATGDAAARDAGAGDAASVDATRDTAAADTAASDTAAADTAAADTATTDTAAGDTAATDVAVTDTASTDTITVGDAAASRPAGQCVVNGDCTGSLTCTVSAPGGICAGCAGSCPLGLAYDCYSGSCVRNCSVDDDCPWGLRCSGGTRCALISCSGETCPVPFTCQGGYCRRPPCSAGCPTDWTCRGTYCTER